jgi:hypothetical protein
MSGLQHLVLTLDGGDDFGGEVQGLTSPTNLPEAATRRGFHDAAADGAKRASRNA